MQLCCKNATPMTATIIYSRAARPPLSRLLLLSRASPLESISVPSSVTCALASMGRRQCRLRDRLGEFSVSALLGSPWRRPARFWLLVLPAAMHEILHKAERDRDKENRDDAGGKHAAEHGQTEEDSSMCSGSRSEHERHDAEDECEGRHEDRPEPHLGCSQGGVHDGLSFLKLNFRKLDDEDRVLGGQSNQHDQANLSEHVVLTRLRSHKLEKPQGTERAEDSDRRDKKNAEGQGPAFILRSENQKHKQQREPENHAGRHTFGSHFLLE